MQQRILQLYSISLYVIIALNISPDSQNIISLGYFRNRIKSVILVLKKIHFKKSLKIPKGQSESVYRRRTDNNMAKRKSTKGQTTINKTYI